MDAGCANDRKRVLLPFGALGAFATISEASSSDSDDPCADDASDSSGRPEMRYDKFIGGRTCIFSRDEFLDFYGDVEGATRWERARVCDSADDADGWDIGADIHPIPTNLRGSDEGSGDGAADAGGSCGDG